MTKLVIFDLDGTLLDTMEDIAGACNQSLEACGCPPRRLEEYNMLVGRGIFNLFRGALPEDMRTDMMVEKMYSHFVPYYNEHICDKTKPYPGIYDMLDRLAAEGIAFAVASNKYQEGTEILIDRLFGKYDFVSILGQREGKPIKPDPEIVHEAMSAFGDISKEEVVYCGDSDVDMQTGINAGVRTIGVTWGFRTREELASYSPWMLADMAEDVCKAILED
jgi:phosphoglycolate phosphatase